ncbi:hypothetical protein ACHAQH_005785 [Verticillium albo-atrum]
MFADYDGSGGSYKVYITTPDLSPETVHHMLCHDATMQDPDSISIESCPGKTAQAIFQHHLLNMPEFDDIDPRFILIFDSAAVQERGILLVSISEYHGYADALRYHVDDGRNTLNSLAIAVENWHTCRECDSLDEAGGRSTNWFALYSLLPPGQEEDFQKAFDKMNEGLKYVGLSDEDEDQGMESAVDDAEVEEDHDDEESNASTIEDALGPEMAEDEASVDEDELVDDDDVIGLDDGSNLIYKPVYDQSCDLAKVMDMHATFAQSNSMNANMFAAIDGEYETEGCEFVAFAASNQGQYVAYIFTTAVTTCEGDVAKQHEILRRIKESLLKTSMIYGIPRVINAFHSLVAALSPGLAAETSSVRGVTEEQLHGSMGIVMDVVEICEVGLKNEMPKPQDVIHEEHLF